MNKNLVFHMKTKHIGIQYHFVRYLVQKGVVEIAEIQKWKKIVAQFWKGFVPSSVHLRTLKDIRELAARVIVDYEEKLEEEKKKGEK